MAQLLALKNLVLGNTSRGGDGSGEKSALAVDALNFGLEEIGKKHDWKDLKVEVDEVLAEDQKTFTIASNYQRVVEARLIDTEVGTEQSSWKVWVFSKEELVQVFPAPELVSTSKPRYMYEEAGKMVLIPPSDGVYTLRYTYLKKPSVLSDDADTADITTVDEALVAYATQYVFNSVQQFEEGRAWRAQYEVALKNAIKEDGKRPAEQLAFKPFFRRSEVRSQDPFVWDGRNSSGWRV